MSMKEFKRFMEMLHRQNMSDDEIAQKTKQAFIIASRVSVDTMHGKSNVAEQQRIMSLTQSQIKEEVENLVQMACRLSNREVDRHLPAIVDRIAEKHREFEKMKGLRLFFMQNALRRKCLNPEVARRFKEEVESIINSDHFGVAREWVKFKHENLQLEIDKAEELKSRYSDIELVPKDEWVQYRRFFENRAKEFPCDLERAISSSVKDALDQVKEVVHKSLFAQESGHDNDDSEEDCDGMMFFGMDNDESHEEDDEDEFDPYDDSEDPEPQ